MNLNSKINPEIFSDVKSHLKRIEQEHNVTIVQAIESGSRAWGFPSPDSDYDVRFIYAHEKDWYLQLGDERDVIELPINDELDIAGWDVLKALKLANKGNAVVQEWMISPIVYQQSTAYAGLCALIKKTFNPTAAHHHYRSMAKKAYLDLENSEQKMLKRFFYFARATLSAAWIVENRSMPSIVFVDLVKSLINDSSIVQDINHLVELKAQESERSSLDVPAPIYDYIVSMYVSLDEEARIVSESALISNDDFRRFLNDAFI